MEENDYSIPAPSGGGGGRSNFLTRRMMGLPVYLWLAIVLVIGIAVYAWQARSTTGEDAPDDSAEGEDPTAAEIGNLYPLMPTGTVYGQAPAAVVDDQGPDTNEAWTARAFSALVNEGMNPGEAQLALQAYLNGDHLSYSQSLIRDKALKSSGLPPQSFEAGTNDPKPAPKPAPAPAPVPKPAPKPTPVVPKTTPKPAPPKPAPKPAPKPKRTHKVVKGDTLWDLAVKYYKNGTKWRTIATANNIKDPKKLQIGKVLVIP